MDDHDNTAAARMLYAMAMAASLANTDREARPFVYDEHLDAFTFADGRFAFDRERADLWFAKALRLQRSG